MQHWSVSRLAGWPKLNLLRRSLKVQGRTTCAGLLCSKWMFGRVICLIEKPILEMLLYFRLFRGCGKKSLRTVWRLWEISVFPLTILIMDVPNIFTALWSLHFVSLTCLLCFVIKNQRVTDGQSAACPINKLDRFSTGRVNKENSFVPFYPA
jgi:hypothetical protein